jgi:DNA-binding beta-propeller fold protein YncE
LKTLRFYFLYLALCVVSCKVDDKILKIEESDYPKDVAKIILAKCATSGCHNTNSNQAAAGLNLDTWDDMFMGTRSGAVVIPYWHTQSSMFLFCNTYNDLGLSNIPTMPSSKNPLSREEVITLRDWIDKGAPNANGIIKFSDYAFKSKYYVATQGCDIINIIDPKLLVPMRYVKVGKTAQQESPHQIQISPDGKYWYVIFTAGTTIQKYSTFDDSFIGEVTLNNGNGGGSGNWNTLVITSNGKYAFAVDWSPQGVINYLDLENLKVLRVYNSDWLKYPHAIALHPNGKKLYVLSQSGNAMYKINIENPLYPELDNTISLDGNPLQWDASNATSLNAHDIRFTPDASKYFITCQKSNEIRVYNAINDAQLASIKVGSYPQEIVFSETTNYAFVSCTEDTITTAKRRGSVAVLDYKNNSLVTKLYAGHQPHGIAVDDANKLVIVANRNQSDDGPAPHHTSECAGRNGNIAFINLTTLEVLPKKIEVTVDPYYVSVKK